MKEDTWSGGKTCEKLYSDNGRAAPDGRGGVPEEKTWTGEEGAAPGKKLSEEGSRVVSEEQQSAFAEAAVLRKQVIEHLGYFGHFLHYQGGGRVGKGRVLRILLEQGEVLQKELQDQICVRSGSLSELIIRMEAEGLIEKLRNPRDGRQIVLRLTPEGKQRARACRRACERDLERLTSCFSQEELAYLCKMLETLEHHWRQTEEEELKHGERIGKKHSGIQKSFHSHTDTGQP